MKIISISLCKRFVSQSPRVTHRIFSLKPVNLHTVYDLNSDIFFVNPIFSWKKHPFPAKIIYGVYHGSKGKSLVKNIQCSETVIRIE